jgi:hypothetical protein
MHIINAVTTTIKIFFQNKCKKCDFLIVIVVFYLDIASVYFWLNQVYAFSIKKPF